ncbi:MAG: serine protease [Treponema sp.]|nr:serine protease [Treponema sp.]
MKKICYALAAACLLFVTGCSSNKAPQKTYEPLDYTDKDVIENEINIIRGLQEKESTRALFRAYLMGQNGAETGIFDECAGIVTDQAAKALEEEDFTTAMRLYKSLYSAGVDVQKNKGLYEDSRSRAYSQVPGFTRDEQKLPKNTNDCINATVTVWVDQGYRVENGAGYADIVIGSGFFIDRRGYLITNHHVISEMVNPKRKTACKLYIKLPSDMEKKIPAKVVGYDSVMDLALLKTEIEPEFVFELGSSSDLSVGDNISAIGTPIGLEGTLTRGIISSSTRQLLTMGRFFQIDAAVNSGNSGGPLIDANRKVQAIVFAGMLQYQGLNFAIPVEYLKQELPLLYRGGEVVHVWTGSYGHDYKVRNEKQGLEIQYVMPGGTASMSGLKIDDVITLADDQKIACLEDFQYMGMKYEPGTIVSGTYQRNGQEQNCLIYLDKRPQAPLKDIYESDFVEDSFIPIFGIKMVRSSTTNKKLYKIEYVLEGSTADQNGFSENDNLELRNIEFYDEANMFAALMVVQRKKKGYLDIGLQLASPYDNPNYF